MTALQYLTLRVLARLHRDERGVASNVLITILVVLAIVAVVLWMVTSFHVSKK